MIERLTAETQARLSYLVIGGYFGLKVIEGLKLIDPVSADLKEVLMAVILFWFMRTRSSQEKPNA